MSHYKYALFRCMFYLVILLIVVGCNPTNAGVYLSVDGKEFSDAEVFIDGESVGQFRQMIKKSSGEVFIEGKHVGNFDSSSKITTEKSYSGDLDYFTLKPGIHRIVIIAKSGKQVEIETTIKAGENYVMYSSEEEKLMWNDKEYKVVPGNVVLIK